MLGELVLAAGGSIVVRWTPPNFLRIAPPALPLSNLLRDRHPSAPPWSSGILRGQHRRGVAAPLGRTPTRWPRKPD
jgi:hypothetical protein